MSSAEALAFPALLLVSSPEEVRHQLSAFCSISLAGSPEVRKQVSDISVCPCY